MKKILLAVMVIITAALVAMFFLKSAPVVIKSAHMPKQGLVSFYVASPEPQAN